MEDKRFYSDEEYINNAHTLLIKTRKILRMSQLAFSQYFNIPKRTIENWETGQRKPPAYCLQLILYRCVTDPYLYFNEKLEKYIEYEMPGSTPEEKENFRKWYRVNYKGKEIAEISE